MGAHRAERSRRATRPGARRLERLRPRYDRLGAVALSLAITAVALLGGFGIIPVRSSAAELAPAAAPRVPAGQVGGQPSASGASSTDSARPAAADRRAADPRALPAASGSGKRVVFSIDDQRVWLVDRAGEVRSTYLVSGSLTDNLKPGSYAVYSRSRWAVGIDDSGVMQYFVRFTRGENAAIGFHSIPTKNGHPLQSTAQLGTPQSHGCIRQQLSDAKRLWAFAPEGTPVVVTA